MPGTKLRTAIEDIMMAHFGAIFVFIDQQKNYDQVLQGGFDLNIAFSPEKVYELAKMDGAIILDQDGQKILKANVHLVPDSKFYTPETGIRHRTADRTSQHLQCMVLAISHRRNALTVYYNKSKYLMKDIKLLLTRVSQALDTIEKYRSSFDRKLQQLDIDEVQNSVNLYDIVEAITKGIKILKINDQVEPFVIELGIEGKLARMQLDEIVEDVEEYLSFIILDYYKPHTTIESEEVVDENNDSIAQEDNTEEKDVKIEEAIEDKTEFTEEDAHVLIANFKKIKELGPLVLCKNLGYDVANINQLDEYIIVPKGYRFLKYIAKVPMFIAKKVVDEFKNLTEIRNADIETLKSVDGIGEKRATSIYKINKMNL